MKGMNGVITRGNRPYHNKIDSILTVLSLNSKDEVSSVNLPGDFQIFRSCDIGCLSKSVDVSLFMK